MAGVAALAEGRRLPGAPKCPIFPRSSHWNKRVDKLPVHPNSDAIVSSIGAEDNVHPDFGSGLYEGAPIGIPYVTVSEGPAARAGLVRVRGRVRPGPVPDPAGRPDRGRPPAPTATAT